MKHKGHKLIPLSVKHQKPDFSKKQPYVMTVEYTSEQHPDVNLCMLRMRFGDTQPMDETKIPQPVLFFVNEEEVSPARGVS